MSYLCYLCLFAYSDVQHILCFVFRRIVYSMLSGSLVCLFLIASSLLSNVYYNKACLVGKEQNEKHNTTLAERFRNSIQKLQRDTKYIPSLGTGECSTGSNPQSC